MWCGRGSRMDGRCINGIVVLVVLVALVVLAMTVMTVMTIQCL